jgi:proteasome lid subunit RPN8/RPN11
MSSTNSSDEFRLPVEIRDEIIAHARAEAPRECCGVIAGDRGRAQHAYRLTNIAPGNRLYEIDPKELYELEFDELPRRGWEIVSIYHSHPATEAYPSRTDVSQAFWSDVSYLICSLAEPAAPDLRAFRIVDEQISEPLLVIE